MRFPFFKTMLVACSLALVCSCDSGNPTGSDPNQGIIVPEVSYIYVDKDKNKYIVSGSGIVTDTTGAVIGLANIELGLIIDNNGLTIAENVNFQKLKKVNPTIVMEQGWIINIGQKNYVIYGNGLVFTANGEAFGTFQATEPNLSVGNIITLEGQIFAKNVNLSTLKQVGPNVGGNIPESSSATAPQPLSSATIPASSSNQIPASSSSPTPASSATIPQSSSSTPVSSSSAPASSSSSKPVSGGSCPTIKYVGSSSNTGFASRYWDCCKPSCAWNGNARQCDRNGTTQIYGEAGSICSGGNSTVCKSQAPFTIDGCDTYGFAFAAVPSSDGGKCGKCYELTPTSSKSCYFDNGNKKCALSNNVSKFKQSGRKLIIMASNIGDDVGRGQFDIMIPGGGAGKFNGCSGFGWGDQGATYGGLLTSCLDANANNTGDKIITCLTEKCNKSFSNDAVAKKGCLFLAEFMFAANNPEVTYREVECPNVLKEKY